MCSKAGQEGSSDPATAEAREKPHARWRATEEDHHARPARARPARRLGPKADTERPAKGERGNKSGTEGGTHAHTRMPSLRTRRGLAELQSGREHEEPSGVARRRRVPRTTMREAQRDGSAPRHDHAEVLQPTGVRCEEARGMAGLRSRHGRVVAAGSSEGRNDREIARELRLRE